MSDAADPRGSIDNPESDTDANEVQPAAPRPTDDAYSMDAINREVADAMASMDTADLTELSGGIGGMNAGIPGDTIAEGTEITGTVVGVSDDEVFLEFGPKAQGVVDRSQFGKKEPIEVGRRVDVVVERYDSGADMLRVNRKGAIQRATWTNMTPGMLLRGRVTGMNKGGLEVDINGIRAFMPASQTDTAPMKDISLLLNETVQCEVVEVDRRHKNVLVSRRKVMEREAAEQREKLRNELEVGQVRKGVVGNIMDYGAFVDIGGIDGLLHIREISWRPVEKVTDVLKVGDAVEVQILKIDDERGRISLGLKQCQPDPWENVEEKYPLESTQKVRIVRLVEFGAFAELEEGLEGLIPISEMGWTRINKTSDAVSVGDLVDAVVIRLEPKKRRIALSMKQATRDPWEGIHESFEPNSTVTGRVTRLADFGVFVELVPGVEAMIHISELSEGRVRACSDVVEEGQEVEARVLGVDPKNRRISLSMKALTAPVIAVPDSKVAAPPHKKRKRPLRGGLASHFDW